MTTAQTAAEAYLRYKSALDAGLVIQGSWHAEQDGRQLACALGTLGPDVQSPKDCPSSVMPPWLAQMVPWFFDRQKEADALAWGERFFAELKRLDGNVPFSVVHDWHANVVVPLALDVCAKHNRDSTPHEALKALHLRALAGEKISANEWHPVLRSADAYADANADAYAYAYADATKRLADGMVECLARVKAEDLSSTKEETG